MQKSQSVDIKQACIGKLPMSRNSLAIFEHFSLAMFINLVNDIGDDKLLYREKVTYPPPLLFIEIFSTPFHFLLHFLVRHCICWTEYAAFLHITFIKFWLSQHYICMRPLLAFSKLTLSVLRGHQLSHYKKHKIVDWIFFRMTSLQSLQSSNYGLLDIALLYCTIA